MDEEAVKNVLAAAYRAVDAADVPEALRPVALREAVRLLTSESQAGQPATAASMAHAPHDTGDPKSLEAVAAKLGLRAETVGEFFHLDGEELSISLAPAKFATQKSAAAKQLALVIAAGRQAGGWDDQWTTSDTIRKVVDDYGKFDSGNFAKTLTGMSDVFGFSGTGATRKVKVNREGYQQAAALINTLSGAET